MRGTVRFIPAYHDPDGASGIGRVPALVTRFYTPAVHVLVQLYELTAFLRRYAYGCYTSHNDGTARGTRQPPAHARRRRGRASRPGVCTAPVFIVHTNSVADPGFIFTVYLGPRRSPRLYIDSIIPFHETRATHVTKPHVNVTSA